MKNKFLLNLLLCLLLLSCSEDDDKTVQNSCDFIDFKYFNETQDFLGQMSNDYLLIGIDSTYSDSQIQSTIDTTKIIDHTPKSIITF